MNAVFNTLTHSYLKKRGGAWRNSDLCTDIDFPKPYSGQTVTSTACPFLFYIEL